MSVLLLGSTETAQNWQVLHKTNSYEEMAEELDMYCDRSKYKSFSVISEKYFDYDNKVIMNSEEAFSETPDFVEDAFCEAFYGGF